MVCYDEMWHRLKHQLCGLHEYFLSDMGDAHEGELMAQAIKIVLHTMDFAEEDAGLTPKLYDWAKEKYEGL